ncbi:nuclease-related domain-containing protein [Catenulispora pinisilvae]|uniref:nuclease-related domain-containing protein n=1 Tax=Catenulispora pinisilvae TaxID=2705253 RepID=UPI00189133F1|nr:nuclease-related domain-containing protein [Catenulispora pinisilvae]
MGELTVKAWKRYGKDRLYITYTATGANVGYYDRQTSELHVEDPDMQYRALEALTPFLSGDISALAHVVDSASPSPGTDLTNNVAGGAVSERAAELSPGRFQRIAAKLLGIRTEATSWEVGAAGERRVGDRLDRLKAHGWSVLHSIPLKSGADIDHVIIGPGGVFTINTKHHPGARVTVNGDFVRVNGQLNHYVRNSRHEASAAAKRLTSACRSPVGVTGVLAFVGVQSLSVKEPLVDVLVVPGERLERLFLKAPPMLSPDLQQRIYAVARRAELWLA